MSEVDQLLTIAEVSVALAGFAGIVATFQFKQQVRINQGHVLALSMIVNISLVGAFFAVLPLIFLNYGMAENKVWALCSGLMGANISMFMIFIWRTQHIGSLPALVKLVYLLFFGAAFDSDFIDDAIDELSEKCPQGKVEGVLTKFETIDYFLMIVAKQELNVRGYCR